jgi:hypothetical protein
VKKILVSITTIFLVGILYGTKPVTLSELSRPAIFIVKFDKAYILEKTTIYIHSLKDFKLIKKFGRAGEGPREFKTTDGGKPMSMAFHQNELVVNSLNKFSYFTPDGEFIKEIKVTVDTLLYPIKDRYLGIGPTPTKKNQQVIGFRHQ